MSSSRSSSAVLLCLSVGDEWLSLASLCLLVSGGLCLRFGQLFECLVEAGSPSVGLRFIGETADEALVLRVLQHAVHGDHVQAVHAAAAASFST